MTEKNIVLNRAVFTQRSFDSSTLTVLTMLFHHFSEAGDYDLMIQRGEQVIQWAPVHVIAENAPPQLDIDLAQLSGPEKGSDCEPSTGYTVLANGVITFYVSQGVGQYMLTITQSTGGEKRTLLNSGEVVPEGDLFGVTLVQPGIYRAAGAEGRGECEITVNLPQGQKYRVDQVTLVKISQDGTFNPSRVQILAGQTVLFLCRMSVRIRVEQQPEVTKAAMARPRERQRYTLRNPRKKASKQ